MEKILKSKYGLLIFSLLSGLGYFILIMMLISNIKFSYLLGIFFFPAVICGGALCLFKAIRGMEQNGDLNRIRAVMVINSVLFLMAVIFLVVSVFS